MSCECFFDVLGRIWKAEKAVLTLVDLMLSCLYGELALNLCVCAELYSVLQSVIALLRAD